MKNRSFIFDLNSSSCSLRLWDLFVSFRNPVFSAPLKKSSELRQFRPSGIAYRLSEFHSPSVPRLLEIAG